MLFEQLSGGRLFNERGRIGTGPKKKYGML
jgi:hypothetical protein